MRFAAAPPFGDMAFSLGASKNARQAHEGPAGGGISYQRGWNTILFSNNYGSTIIRQARQLFRGGGLGYDLQKPSIGFICKSCA